MSDATPLKVLFHPAPTPGIDGEPRTHAPVALSVDPAELSIWLRRRLSVNARPSALAFREPDLLHLGALPDRALGDEAEAPAPVRAARRVMPLPSGRGLLAEAREAARALSAGAAAEQAAAEIDPFGFEAGLNAAAEAAVTSGRSALPTPRRSYLRSTAPRNPAAEIDPFFGADAVAYDEVIPAVEPEEIPSPDAIVAAAGYWEDSPLEETKSPETGELGIESLWADEPDLPIDPIAPQPAQSSPAISPIEPLPSFEYRPPSILLPDSELPPAQPPAVPPPLVVSLRSLSGSPAEPEASTSSETPSDLAAATRPLTVPPLVVSLRSLSGNPAEPEAPTSPETPSDLAAAARPLTVPPLVVSFRALSEVESESTPAELPPILPTPVVPIQPLSDDLLDSLLD